MSTTTATQPKPSVSASKDALAAIFGTSKSNGNDKSGERLTQEVASFNKGNNTGANPVPVTVTSAQDDDDGSHSPTSKPTQPPPSSSTTQNGSATPKESDDRGRAKLQPPASTARFDRSVSPGTLDDGSHQLCGGEKGESYEPSRGFGRLKDKFRSKGH